VEYNTWHGSQLGEVVVAKAGVEVAVAVAEVAEQGDP
jgi:hypothetical protein